MYNVEKNTKKISSYICKVLPLYVTKDNLFLKLYEAKKQPNV